MKNPETYSPLLDAIKAMRAQTGDPAVFSTFRSAREALGLSPWTEGLEGCTAAEGRSGDLAEPVVLLVVPLATDVGVRFGYVVFGARSGETLAWGLHEGWIARADAETSARIAVRLLAREAWNRRRAERPSVAEILATVRAVRKAARHPDGSIDLRDLVPSMSDRVRAEEDL